MAFDEGSQMDRLSRSGRIPGRMTTEMRRLEQRALDLALHPACDSVIAGIDDADDASESPVVAVLAEGTGVTRAIDGPDEMTELIHDLVTPLTVIMAVQQRMVSAVQQRGDDELLAELRRSAARGQEAMDTIHRVLAELRARNL
jgi:hypothetical protein